jgi:hypothetical protein
MPFLNVWPLLSDTAPQQSSLTACDGTTLYGRMTKQTGTAALGIRTCSLVSNRGSCPTPVFCSFQPPLFRKNVAPSRLQRINLLLRSAL